MAIDITAYMKHCRDPGAMRAAFRELDEWRKAAVEQFPEAEIMIDLEVNVRALLLSFEFTVPYDDGRQTANAVVTAVTNAVGVMLAVEAANPGSAPLDNMLDAMTSRVRLIYAEEMERRRASQ